MVLVGDGDLEVVLGTNTFQHLPAYGEEVRRRWPDVQCLAEGEFGEAFRSQFMDNSRLDYRFVERGSGIHGSDANLEIRWFMNRDFRLALLHDWTAPGDRENVIDFTRYDLKAAEPNDFGRNWSLMNRINQKGTRPQDKPVLLTDLSAEDQALIRRRLPELFQAAGAKTEIKSGLPTVTADSAPLEPQIQPALMMFDAAESATSERIFFPD